MQHNTLENTLERGEKTGGYQLSFQEPQIVSIYHDGIEVIRIENGETSVLFVSNPSPLKLEIFWDGRLVYCLFNGVLEYNVMIDQLNELQQIHLASKVGVV